MSIGILHATSIIDAMIAQCSDTGDVHTGDLEKFISAYREMDSAGRASVKGFVERRVRESVESDNLVRARAVIQIRLAIIAAGNSERS